MLALWLRGEPVVVRKVAEGLGGNGPTKFWSGHKAGRKVQAVTGGGTYAVKLIFGLFA
jgi:hypothetical protein